MSARTVKQSIRYFPAMAQEKTLESGVKRQAGVGRGAWESGRHADEVRYCLLEPP